MSRLSPGLIGLLLLAGCSRTPEPVPAARLKPFNLVVVTIDTLRADHVHCYGYDRVETPVLDRLAARGTLFENAVAQTPLTPPSHASIFTGMYPNAHHVRNTGGFVLQSSSLTLAKILQQQGWDTAAFVGSSVLKKLFGFNQGFAVYDDQMPKPDKSALSREDPERRAGQVIDRALAWLNAQSGKPFFVWVHLFDPHMPYDPPEPFHTRYRGHLYDGEVAYADAELGRFLDAVEKKAPGKTIVAAMSDHGESLGEHGEFTHGVFLYDATLRIPLIMAGPGVPAGKRVREQARTIDVLPTILNLMGATPPARCQGVSLLSGKSASHSYAETLYPKMNMGWAELRAIRTNRWKYIRAPKPELYDLTSDPHEMHNIFSQHGDEVKDLEAQLRNVVRSEREKVETNLVDQRTMDQLKSLGYLANFSARQYELTGKGIDPKDRAWVLKAYEDAAGPDSKLPPARRIEILRRTVAEDPENPSGYYFLATEYEKTGRYDQAMKIYETALARGIQNGRLYSRIADLYLKRGDKQAAITHYERAAQFNPNDTDAQTNLATAYLESGRAADAERIYKWIITAGDQIAAAYNGLGLIAIQRQDAAGARGYFERAVQLDPDLPEPQLNLGLIYRMAGDNMRARACFEAFLAKAPPRQYAQIIPKVKQELASMP